MTPAARCWPTASRRWGSPRCIGARRRRPRLLAYLALLDKWNRTHNLTAIREPERMITHHLLDSLAVLPHLPAGAGLRVLDVGSGGGLPGIPLAIVRPDWQVALLDSNYKKAAFLRQAAIELPLPNAEVVAARVEDYAPAAAFDIAISRAFSDLAVFAAASARPAGAGRTPGRDERRLSARGDRASCRRASA